MELDDIKINTESDNDFSIIQYNYLNHEILDPVFINSIISDNSLINL